MKTKLVIIIGLVLVGFTGMAKNKDQKIAVDGIVYENVNGEQKPLALAYVYIENSEVCTYTDEEGRFNLELPKGKQTMHISFKGFNAVEKTVVVKNSVEPIKLVLDPAKDSLAELNK